MPLERLPNDDFVEMEYVVAIITDHHLDAKPVFGLAIIRLSTGDEIGVRFQRRSDAINWAVEFMGRVNACKERRYVHG
jgi:hypothetical protein